MTGNSRALGGGCNGFDMSQPHQWEFRDPKMEVLYHIFGHILGGYSLT